MVQHQSQLCAGVMQARRHVAVFHRHLLVGRQPALPADAPQLSAKGSFVYVIKADSSAELRPVKLGQRQGELVVVDQGLKADERVVVNGQLGVTPGAKVRLAFLHDAEGRLCVGYADDREGEWQAVEFEPLSWRALGYYQRRVKRLGEVVASDAGHASR